MLPMRYIVLTLHAIARQFRQYFALVCCRQFAKLLSSHKKLQLAGKYARPEICLALFSTLPWFWHGQLSQIFTRVIDAVLGTPTWSVVPGFLLYPFRELAHPLADRSV